ncbi:MAG: ATP synthase subunit alpha [Rhodospirillaceae bacterium]|nr:MAG: ATP synthase subunit alpha [Rhodospirillaceae bacterium]
MTLPASDPPFQRLTRFAPSPTGRLHLGHVLAAEQVWSMAERLGAPVLLRVEDIDTTRCRPAFETAMLDYMNSEKKALMDKINEKGDYNGEIEAEIKESLDQFKATQTW